ncbi:CCE_0567 family metalloprotein [Sinorhizobium meliloti]|uniref:CCE_0567 family metalloprotein n=1 Tax=Rhizobium meliloti TaxID=382 RepID=UPI00398CA519
MSDLEEPRRRMQKLQSRAGTAMMKLHDLAEDLPSKWTEIMAVAKIAFHAFAELGAVKRELAESENTQ